MQTSYWLILFVILLIIEILTMGLTTIWFAAARWLHFWQGCWALDCRCRSVSFWWYPSCSLY